MWNIIIGLVFAIGGFSGKISLFGLVSSTMTGVIGVAFALWGVYQMIQARGE